MPSDQCLPPVFIISPTGKSGTNFLSKVLIELELCERPQVDVLTREDYLLFHSDHLQRYAQGTAHIWKRWENDDGRLRLRTGQLLKHLGDGILQFFGAPSDSRKRLVVKTPTSQQLAIFPDLFPEAKLILLVRDGRDATESQVKAGYRPDHESAFENWAARTRELLEFTGGRGKNLQGTSWLMVQYEELVKAPEIVGKTLAQFLERDDVVTAPAVIRDLPVFGSVESQEEREHSQPTEWRVAQKPKDFNPVGRWCYWDRERRQQFKKLAGKELIELGYEPDESW